jgi:CRISPR-associated protein Csd1
MLLKRLAEYSELLPSQPTFYANRPVRYIIELDRDGKLLNRAPTDRADERNARGAGMSMPAAAKMRTSATRPILFASDAEYTLGLARKDGAKGEPRASQRHRAYLDMLRRCAERTGLPEVRVVSRFLEDAPLSRLSLGGDFDRAATVTFRVDGVFPSNLRAAQRFWADEHDPAAANVPVMQCAVCGEQQPVLERLPTIKGIRGGARPFISANKEAFLSYGLGASLVAPTCVQCAESFSRALTDLIATQRNRAVVGSTTFVFWTREPCEFSFRDFLTSPRSEQVRALIESVRSGWRAVDFKDSAFYAAALTWPRARVAVRDWIDSTTGRVRENLGRWFERQSIVGPFGEPPRPFGITDLAAATVRELRDLGPATPRALMRTALTGASLPFDPLYQAVRRNRAEQRVTHARAALIKLVLRSRSGAAMEESMVSLNSEDRNPAYLCGRLLALLERAQYLAVKPKATIVDRFYGAASSSPRFVYPSLLKMARSHLSKLARDNPGARAKIEAQVEEIASGILTFPATLTLEEQGLFSLGYYHQRAHDRARAKEARAAREAAAESEADQEGEN